MKKNVHQYRVTSPLFGDKIRMFDTKQEAHKFCDTKLLKMATAQVKWHETIDELEQPDAIKKKYREMKRQVSIERIKNMDIRSSNSYPSNALSNFAIHPFEFQGVPCLSMEGFLQSLKVKNPEMQKHICMLAGKEAKASGAKRNWQRKQELYWQGRVIKRSSDEYQELITAAFDALATNTGFQKALLATGNATITHSLGKKKKPAETTLTSKEFCGQLVRLRKALT